MSTRPILEEINRFLPRGHIQLRGHVRRATTWSSGVCACLCACLLVLPVTLPPVSAHVITRVRRLRMWGGFGSTKNGDAVGDYLSDLWHWSLRTGTWTEHHPKGPMPQLRKWSNFWSTHNGDMVRLDCLSEHTHRETQRETGTQREAHRDRHTQRHTHTHTETHTHRHTHT